MAETVEPCPECKALEAYLLTHESAYRNRAPIDERGLAEITIGILANYRQQAAANSGELDDLCPVCRGLGPVAGRKMCKNPDCHNGRVPKGWAKRDGLLDKED